MYGFKPGKKPKAEGVPTLKTGMINGPGSGTSDSIKAKIPAGSYIMPADSTEQIGQEALENMGARWFRPRTAARNAVAPGLGFRPRDVTANVSNGEFELPPEQVHAIGVQVLDTMKDGTHTPVARGFRARDSELYFANGGAVESTDELLARIQAKYGTAGVSTANAPSSTAAPTQQRASAAPMPAPAPTIAGAANALRNRRQQIDAAAGYADGGLVDEEEPRTVDGAPGVHRTGNSYSDAAATPAATSTPGTPSANSSQGFGFKPRADGMDSTATTTATHPRFGFGPQAASTRTRTPTFGETMNRTNDERAQRTGAGLYGTPRDPAQRQASGSGFLDRAAPNTMTAIRGAGENIAESYKVGGFPGAAGAVVRNTMVPALGFADDVASGAKRLIDPAANALKTAVTGDATPIEPTPGTGATATPQQQAATPTSSTGTSAPAASTATPEPFNASDLTQQQRDTAGDAYRTAWQQQAPGGLRGAGQDATTLYNAEQQVRGTGITATRQPNGAMSFSGDGANALPQTYTQGVDMNLGNERMARANAIREEMSGLRDRLDFNGGQAVGRQKTNEEIARDMVVGNSRAGQQIGVSLMNGAADRALKQQELGFRSRAEQDRLDMERQRMNADVEARGFQNRSAGRLEALQTQYEQAGTPGQRAQLAEQIRMLSGREAPNRYTVVPGGQEWDPVANVMRTVPSRVLNNQSGQFVDQQVAPGASAAPRAGEVRGGYRFKGGNPADQASWEKV